MASTKTHLQQQVQDEAYFWGNDVADAYHGAAAKDMDLHWSNYIAPVLKGRKLNLAQCIDFAAGYGRNTRKLVEMGAKHVTLIDVNPDCIGYMREQFKGDQFRIVQNSGSDLSDIESDSCTFLYSFDAMVHFDLLIIGAYLPEFHRVMVPDAFAMIHHSNYTANPGADFRKNPHWRNFMSADIFRHIATRAGFSVEKQHVIDWGVKRIDCITILRK